MKRNEPMQKSDANENIMSNSNSRCCHLLLNVASNWWRTSTDRALANRAHTKCAASGRASNVETMSSVSPFLDLSNL
eukprot:6140131-Amphidinium_carterae.1